MQLIRLNILIDLQALKNFTFKEKIQLNDSKIAGDSRMNQMKSNNIFLG